MKKFLTFLLTVLTFFCFGLFTACSEEQETNQEQPISLTGTYKFYSVSYRSDDGIETIRAGVEYEGNVYSADCWVLVLNEDNTFSLSISMFGTPDSGEGTWTGADNEKVILSVPEETETMMFFVDGKKLTTSFAQESGGNYTLILMKD